MATYSKIPDRDSALLRQQFEEFQDASSKRAPLSTEEAELAAALEKIRLLEATGALGGTAVERKEASLQQGLDASLSHRSPDDLALQRGLDASLSHMPADDLALQQAMAASLSHRSPDDLVLQQAMAKSLLTSGAGFEATERTKGGGLYNIGNTCYLNSLVQAVFKHGESYKTALITKANVVILEPIVEGIVGDPERAKKVFKERSKLLLDIIKLSEKENPTKVSNQELRDKLLKFKQKLSSVPQYAQFATGQHDPSELFYALGQFLDIETLLPCMSMRTHLRSELTETNVGFKERSDASYTIVLKGQDKSSIQQAIDDQFMHPEHMTGPNALAFGPERAQVFEPGYKTDFFLASAAPNEIIIQAPRFSQRVKPRIKFFNWELKAAEAVRERNNKSIAFDPEIEIPLFDDEGTQAEKKLVLALDSVVAHRSTSMRGGHYVAYKRQANGSFLLYNDSVRSVITQEDAMARIAKEGYLAVYKKVRVEDIVNPLPYGSIPVRSLGYDCQMEQMPPIESEDDLVLVDAEAVAETKTFEGLKRLGCPTKDASEDVLSHLDQACQAMFVKDEIANTAINVSGSIDLAMPLEVLTADLAGYFIENLTTLNTMIETATEDFEFKEKTILKTDFQQIKKLFNLMSKKEHRLGLEEFIESKKAKAAKQVYIPSAVLQACQKAQSAEDFEAIGYVMRAEFTKTSGRLISVKIEVLTQLIQDSRLQEYPLLLEAIKRQAYDITLRCIRKISSSIVFNFLRKGTHKTDTFTIGGTLSSRDAVHKAWDDAINHSAADELIGLVGIQRIARSLGFKINGIAIGEIDLRLKREAGELDGANGTERDPSDNIGQMSVIIEILDQLNALFAPKPESPIPPPAVDEVFTRTFTPVVAAKAPSPKGSPQTVLSDDEFFLAPSSPRSESPPVITASIRDLVPATSKLSPEVTSYIYTLLSRSADTPRGTLKGRKPRLSDRASKIRF